MHHLPFLGKLCMPQLCIMDFLLLNADRDFHRVIQRAVSLKGVWSRRICILAVARNLQICSKFLLPASPSQLCNRDQAQYKIFLGTF